MNFDLKQLNFELEGSKNFYINSSIPIVHFQYPLQDAEDLKKTVLTLEHSLKVQLEKIKDDGMINPGGTKTKNIFTNAHHYYNILSDNLFKDNPGIKKFKLFLAECFHIYVEILFNETRDIFYTKCWMNRLEKFDFLDIHHHTAMGRVPMISCHYDLSPIKNDVTHTCYYDVYNKYLTEQDPKNTLFGNYYKENKLGLITCFPAFLPHRTTPVRTNEYRYTLGMDVIFDEGMYQDRKIGSIYEKLTYEHKQG